MNIFYVDIPQGKAKLEELLPRQEEGLLVNFNEGLFVFCGQSPSLREEECKRLGVPIIKIRHYGGAIVTFPGDLNILEIKNGQSDFGLRALKAMEKYLRSKGLPALMQNNDLLLVNLQTKEKFKVGSYGSNWYGTMMETSVHFSLNVDIGLINTICAKPMEKVPFALSEYDLTAQEIWEVVKQEAELNG